ncbi:MAG: hypothetical protein IKB12_06030 [Clostridia bacterium]|nr:hypothetical protein [Clostridia bacterium]
MKKTLSIILAILMIVTTVPFAFAAEDYTYDEATDTYTVYTFAGLETALIAGGNTILGADIIRDDTTVLTAVPENITAVLDLNGNTITTAPSVPGVNYEIIIVNGNLTIKDSGINGTIDSTASSVSSCLRVEGGSLTIDAGNFICDTNLAFAVDVFSGNAVINGGAFTNFNVFDEGKAVINGGEFQSNIWTSGSLIINGGTFYGKEYTFGGTFDIYGGEFHENPTNYVAEGCDITENDNGTWTVTCNHSFTNYVETTAPTCTQTGLATAKCDICSIVTDEKELPALNHKDTLETVEAKAPTCTEIGWDAYEYCTACDYTTYAEKAALDHDIVIDEAVAPKCGETGLTQGQHCSRCDAMTVVQETVPALTHTDADGDYKCDYGCGHEFEKRECACGKEHKNFFDIIICFVMGVLDIISDMLLGE